MNTDDKTLEYMAEYQTRTRGSNEDEYDIYVACMQGTGEYIKTYDEWINS